MWVNVGQAFYSHIPTFKAMAVKHKQKLIKQIKRLIKKLLILGYCHGWLSLEVVQWVYDLCRLRAV